MSLLFTWYRRYWSVCSLVVQSSRKGSHIVCTLYVTSSSLLPMIALCRISPPLVAFFLCARAGVLVHHQRVLRRRRLPNDCAQRIRPHRNVHLLLRKHAHQGYLVEEVPHPYAGSIVSIVSIASIHVVHIRSHSVGVPTFFVTGGSRRGFDCCTKYRVCMLVDIYCPQFLLVVFFHCEQRSQ